MPITKVITKMHVLSSNTRSQSKSVSKPQKAVSRRGSLNDFKAAIHIIAAAQGLDPDLVLCNSRSRAKIALCRQIAMYVAHVSLGFSQALVGQLFHRDRSTVAHACARIEDMRDDKTFDETLTHLEKVLGLSCAIEEIAEKELSQ